MNPKTLTVLEYSKNPLLPDRFCDFSAPAGTKNSPFSLNGEFHVTCFLVQCLLARSAFYTRLGNVDFEFVLSQGIGIEHADGLLSLSLGRHGHKGKTL